jgi:hypothetical protein
MIPTEPQVPQFGQHSYSIVVATLVKIELIFHHGRVSGPWIIACSKAIADRVVFPKVLGHRWIENGPTSSKTGFPHKVRMHRVMDPMAGMQIMYQHEVLIAHQTVSNHSDAQSRRSVLALVSGRCMNGRAQVAAGGAQLGKIGRMDNFIGVGIVGMVPYIDRSIGYDYGKFHSIHQIRGCCVACCCVPWGC